MGAPIVTDPASPQNLRCFVGVPLPAAIRVTLATACRRWADQGVTGSWVPPANYHLTLQFLGDTTPSERMHLEQTLPQAFGACDGPRLCIQGTGIFPHRNRPRVLFAAVAVRAGSCEQLVRIARAGASSIGRAPEERAHHPHVTLLRLRQVPSRAAFDSVLRDGETLVSDEFQAQTVALWESRRLPGGVVYRQLREFPLR